MRAKFFFSWSAAISFPVIPRTNFADPDWIEQRQHEREALLRAPVPRRPFLILYDREAGPIPTLAALAAFSFMLFVIIAVTA